MNQPITPKTPARGKNEPTSIGGVHRGNRISALCRQLEIVELMFMAQAEKGLRADRQRQERKEKRLTNK